MSGILESLDPWQKAGVLDATDVHVAATVAGLWHHTPHEVALALALAVRAPRHGHLAVDLFEPSPPWEDAAATHELALPDDRRAWADAVARSQAVWTSSGDTARSKLPFVLDGPFLYTARYWNYQASTVDRIRGMVDAPSAEGARVSADEAETLGRGLDLLFRPPGTHRDRDPDDEALNRQRVGAAMACTRRFCVITGGPGMGKTWTIRNVLALWYVQHALRVEARGGEATASPLRVALAAPTGKAAARMRASIRDGLDERLRPVVRAWLGASPLSESVEAGLVPWLLDLPAFTLHRLLGYRGDRPSRFRHHHDAPLPYDAVVVDETSMVDFAMMAKLLDALGPAARVVLLGDRNQLASVEAGTVLADICGPVRAETVRLSTRGAAELRLGPSLPLEPETPALEIADDAPRLHDGVVQFDRTYRFSPTSGIGRFAAACLVEPFDAGPAVDALTDPATDDVAVLAPLDDDTLSAAARELVVDGYAAYLEVLGSAEPVDQDEERRVHRRALETFDRFRILCAHRRGRLGVAGLNEQVELWLRRAGFLSDVGRFFEGRPVLVQQNDYGVRRFNGDVGLVVRPRFGPHQGRRVVVFPGAERADTVEYLAPARLPRHDTVFAMTVHKSQGSEYEHAMVVLPGEPSAVCTRELVYTGVTRARARITMVARRRVLEAALDRRVKRASGLEAALWRPSGAG